MRRTRALRVGWSGTHKRVQSRRKKRRKAKQKWSRLRLPPPLLPLLLRRVHCPLPLLLILPLLLSLPHLHPSPTPPHLSLGQWMSSSTFSTQQMRPAAQPQAHHLQHLQTTTPHPLPHPLIQTSVLIPIHRHLLPLIQPLQVPVQDQTQVPTQVLHHLSRTSFASAAISP